VLHNTPACSASTSSPEVDRERTYLAALLALHMRGYVILKTQAPSYIEASNLSVNAPSVAPVRWLVGIGPDASLNVDVPDDQRAIHPRVATWYDSLLVNTIELQCRDTNWLRWEAQNKGLVPIGAPEIALAAAGATAGGEAADPPQQAPPSAAPVLEHPNAERMERLASERSQIPFVRSFVFAGVGAGIGVLGLSTTLYSAGLIAGGCQPDDWGEDDCTLKETGQIMLPIGLSALAVAATMLALALPRGIRGLRRFRERGRELKLLGAASLVLSTPSVPARAAGEPLAVSPSRSAWGLTLKGAF